MAKKRMTEVQWLACNDPTLMWDFLWKKGSNRKRQLIACACCRSIWHLLAKQPEVFRHLLEMCEEAADGLVTDDQLNDAWPYTEIESGHCGHEGLATLAATGVSARWDYQDAQQFAAAAATGQHDYYDLDPTIPTVAAELEAQTNLIRCIIGNPFRSVTLDPTWLTWRDGFLASMAKKMYDSRNFTDLPVLADALEEADCDNADILNHLRRPGIHVRGCWCVDLLLGQE